MCVDIDKLGKEDPVERGVLADEDSLAPLDVMLVKELDDAFSDRLRGGGLADLRPCEPIDLKACRVDFFPLVEGSGNMGLKLIFQLSRAYIDNFKRDLDDPMFHRIQTVRF